MKWTIYRDSKQERIVYPDIPLRHPYKTPYLPPCCGNKRLLIHFGIRGFRRDEVSCMSSLLIGFMLDSNLALQFM